MSLPLDRRRHKYHAKAAVVDGIRFASQREARRFGELKMLVLAGQISNLTLQDRWALMVPWLDGKGNKRAIGHYVSDFRYYDEQAHEWVTEDAKGFRTPLYKWKKKHVEAQYGIQIREV